MGELTPIVRPPAVPHPRSSSQAKSLVKDGVLLFLWGWALGLLPLVLGLPLAARGKGFVQALGVLLVAVSPIVDAVVVVTLLANAVPRRLWIGTLFGLLLSTAVVVGTIMRLLAAL